MKPVLTRKQDVGTETFYATGGTTEAALFEAAIGFLRLYNPLGGTGQVSVDGLDIEVIEVNDDAGAEHLKEVRGVQISSGDGFARIVELVSASGSAAGSVNYKIERSTESFLLSLIMRLA